MHLGKKFRAQRAILNWKHSWLSREILFYTIFIALLSGQIIFFPDVVWLAWIAVLAGFLTLFAIDNVYTVIAAAQKQQYHSAKVLLTGLFLASLISEFLFGIVLFGGIKLILYFRQFHRRFVHGNGHLILFGSIRILLGFIIPAIIWIWSISGAFTFSIILILIAELIDRCEFYESQKLITPSKQMVIDIEELVKNV
jgi:DMSO reductase anchor subunit